jgi:uncharacterized protein (TIGR03118 family)
MTRLSLFKLVFTTGAAIGALCAGATLAKADNGYLQTNLVSDIPGLAAITDPNLTNPWGVSFLPGSPIWVSNQGSNTLTLYPVTGSTGVSASPFTVTSGIQGPTGQVANPMMTGFDVGHGGNGKPADFIFANLNGSISAWNASPSLTTAVTQTTTPGASYTGLAINQAGTMLFAANDKGAGSVNEFNSSFSLVGSIMTPTAITSAGLVPFNVQDIGSNIYVTYAPSGHIAQASASLGEGAVAVFNQSGVLENSMIGGNLASPWGVALAPTTFGKFGGDLLVGNFSFFHSEINAFNPVTDAFEGSIDVDPGLHNAPGGLWSLTFGGGGNDGSPNTLYFTDGINNENGGLFGAIAAVPEPSTWVMMFMGLGGLGFAAARRRRTPLAIV